LLRREAGTEQVTARAAEIITAELPDETGTPDAIPTIERAVGADGHDERA
jgi:hypothetical protein